MKIVNGCIKSDDANRLKSILCFPKIIPFELGLGGFTDENGLYGEKNTTYKAIDYIKTPEEIEDDIMFLVDFLMAMKGLSGSNYHKIITTSLEDMAQERVELCEGFYQDYWKGDGDMPDLKYEWDEKYKYRSANYEDAWAAEEKWLREKSE